MWSIFAISFCGPITRFLFDIYVFAYLLFSAAALDNACTASRSIGTVQHSLFNFSVYTRGLRLPSDQPRFGGGPGLFISR